MCVNRLTDLLALTNKAFQKSFNLRPKSVAICVMLIVPCTGLSDQILPKLQQTVTTLLTTWEATKNPEDCKG